ncbi:hypothetical protein LLT6_01740 [Lactococcus cremoris subsp. cremoris TIFN6]|uniref:Uncharacterized protein n=1 Tax=Lactococcus cremoris subsp. cremoris TIFN6 TaxID=1234876 RepID=T0TEE9_LACLC|nr:hypothetical protein LLT6_01740 [Lactococcus cremoris subsp. cremoris TIFN6]
MLNGNEYVVTVKDNKTDEAYLSVIVENVSGGKMVKSIVQNSKVSTEVNEDHVKNYWLLLMGQLLMNYQLSKIWQVRY